MDKLLNEFETYCQTPGVDSGKARSYSKAVQYLCDFLHEKNINEEVVIKMKSIEPYLSLPDSQLYEELLSFLENRRQSSYLKKRFIKAALKYFFDFWDNKNYHSL